MDIFSVIIISSVIIFVTLETFVFLYKLYMIKQKNELIKLLNDNNILLEINDTDYCDTVYTGRKISIEDTIIFKQYCKHYIKFNNYNMSDAKSNIVIIVPFNDSFYHKVAPLNYKISFLFGYSETYKKVLERKKLYNNIKSLK